MDGNDIRIIIVFRRVATYVKPNKIRTAKRNEDRDASVDGIASLLANDSSESESVRHYSVPGMGT